MSQQSGNDGLEARRRLEVGIPAANLKTFAQAIQFLGRVGKELQLEGTTDKLILRTINDAKSAYAAIFFNSGFFDFFRSGAEVDDAGDVQSVTCKVLLKAVHNLFRSLRKLHRLTIAVEEADEFHVEPRLIFQMHCEYGIKKEHRLSMQDCHSLYAHFDEAGTTSLVAAPKKLLSLLNPFDNSAEVVATVKEDNLALKSKHPDAGTRRAVISTQMKCASTEFDAYAFRGGGDAAAAAEAAMNGTGGEQQPSELEFSLKEPKALLAFCEATDLEVTVHMADGGQPMRLAGGSNAFSVDLILATTAVRGAAALAANTDDTITPVFQTFEEPAANGKRRMPRGWNDEDEEQDNREGEGEGGGEGEGEGEGEGDWEGGGPDLTPAQVLPPVPRVLSSRREDETYVDQPLGPPASSANSAQQHGSGGGGSGGGWEGGGQGSGALPSASALRGDWRSPMDMRRVTAGAVRSAGASASAADSSLHLNGEDISPLPAPRQQQQQQQQIRQRPAAEQEGDVLGDMQLSAGGSQPAAAAQTYLCSPPPMPEDSQETTHGVDASGGIADAEAAAAAAAAEVMAGAGAGRKDSQQEDSYMEQDSVPFTSLASKRCNRHYAETVWEGTAPDAHSDEDNIRDANGTDDLEYDEEAETEVVHAAEAATHQAPTPAVSRGGTWINSTGSRGAVASPWSGVKTGMTAVEESPLVDKSAELVGSELRPGRKRTRR